MTAPPIDTREVQKILSMLDQDPTKARGKLTVHELRVVADVLREFLQHRESVNGHALHDPTDFFGPKDEG